MSARFVEGSGSVDGNSYPKLMRAIDVAAREGVRQVILDMSRMTYFSSAAIAVSTDYRIRMWGIDGCLGLYRMPKEVRIVFDMIGLTEFFPIAETESDMPAACEAWIRVERSEVGWPVFILKSNQGVTLHHQYGCVMCDRTELKGIAVPAETCDDPAIRRQIERFANRHQGVGNSNTVRWPAAGLGWMKRNEHYRRFLALCYAGAVL